MGENVSECKRDYECPMDVAQAKPLSQHRGPNGMHRLLCPPFPPPHVKLHFLDPFPYPPPPPPLPLMSQVLALRQNLLKDIHLLARLTTLVELDVYDNELETIHAVEHLTKLEYVRTDVQTLLHRSAVLLTTTSFCLSLLIDLPWNMLTTASAFLLPPSLPSLPPSLLFTPRSLPPFSSPLPPSLPLSLPPFPPSLPPSSSPLAPSLPSLPPSLPPLHPSLPPSLLFTPPSLLFIPPSLPPLHPPSLPPSL